MWTGVPGTNLAHDTYGYPWPAAPDCDESNVGTGGCVNDGVGFFQGQCTSWVALPTRPAQRHRVQQLVRRAATGATPRSGPRSPRASTTPPTRCRRSGAVGWYARGHVSYVEEVNTDGSVVISEMNIDGHNGFVVHTVYPGDTSWPDRFLHLADVVPVDITAPGRPEPVTATTADQGVRVAWKAPADDVGVTGYRVLRNGMPLAETEAPSYVDRQASPGQAYTYSVVAHDEAGNVSEPATTVLGQDVPAPPRQQGPFLPGSASVIAAGDSTAVCGRLGTERDPRVGCRLRTLGGWTTVRTGRSVPWGLAGHPHLRVRRRRPGLVLPRAGRERRRPTPACRSTSPPGAGASTGSTGATRSPADATWVTTAAEPTRCGTAGERATCSVLLERGWRTRTDRTRHPPGRPAVAGLRRDRPRRRASAGRSRVAPPAPSSTYAVSRGAAPRPPPAKLPHGRWVSRPAGPTLCLPAAGCRTLGPAKG